MIWTDKQLVLVEVAFNITSVEGLKSWQAKAKKLASKYGSTHWDRKEIFITTHSEQNQGDLFSGYVQIEKDKIEGWAVYPNHVSFTSWYKLTQEAHTFIS